MGKILDRFIKWGTGTDENSAKDIPADFNPTNYTPQQVSAEGNDKLSAHLNGINSALIATSGVSLENLSKYRTNIDSDGIYTVVTYKRADNTTYMQSTLSGGAAPEYATRTVKFYQPDGITEIIAQRLIFSLSYNQGEVISEVLT